VNNKKEFFIRERQFITLLAITAAVITIAGCGSQPVSQTSARQSAINAATPIRTEPAQRPSWVDLVPDSPTTLSFIGSAGRYATATGNQGARFFAEENGRSQLVDYYGTLMVNQARTHAATYGISSDVFAPQVAGQQLNERIAQSVSQALAPREYYTLVYLDVSNREAYEVYVLMQIEKTIVRNAINNYGQEQAADYARKAAAEQDAARRQQFENAAEFFGGNLSSRLGI